MGDSMVGRPCLALSSRDITCATFQTLVLSSLDRGVVLVDLHGHEGSPMFRSGVAKSPGVKPQAASTINSARNKITLRVVVTSYIIADLLVGGGH